MRFLLKELDALVVPGAEGETSGSADRAAQITVYQRFFYQKALRNLNTSLRFLNSHRKLRSDALCSRKTSWTGAK
jgi:polysaccharide biosynthesis transport protein